MLKKRISKSRKLAALKNDTGRVLWLMLLPHLDAEGRIEADPYIIKGTVCPYISTLTLKTIETSLKDLHCNGLITGYTIDGEDYLQYTRFDDFNRINRDREAKSHIPTFLPEQVWSNAGVTPCKVKLIQSKLKLSEDKIIHREFVKLTTEEFEKLNAKFGEKAADDLIARLDSYIGQIGEVKARNKYKSHYYTILNWARRDGITSLEKKKTSAEKVKELVDAGLLEEE